MGAQLSRIPLYLATLLLLMVVLSLGLVYGHWTKTLNVQGTVNTGNLDAGWFWWHTCQEFNSWPNPPSQPNELGESGGVDIASSTMFLDPAEPQLLYFTIENGYPSYAVDCEVEFGNTGSIPWIVRGNSLQAISPNLTGCILSGSQTKTLLCDQLTVVFADNIGAQVDPGDYVASSLRVHVEQPAQPDETYQFAVQICASQWNEAANFEQCLASGP